MRGWAALSVLFYHAFWETFGVKFPAFRDPAFNFVFHGRLAVYIFFILSGDALISPYLASNNIAVIRRLSIKRYIRLTAPILLSCLLGYAVLKLGLNRNIEAATILHREDWLGIFLKFGPSLLDVITQSLYDVYFNYSKYESYNPFLWTMSIEMLGSLMVFMFALQINTLKKPALTALAIAGLFFLAKTYYALFFIGIAFAILRADGFFERRHSKIDMAISWALIVLVIGSCLRSHDIATDGHRTNMLRSIALVYAIHSNRTVISAMASGLSKFLGRVSFPLYLVHFSVLTSFTSFLVLYCDQHGYLTATHAVCIGLSTVALSLLLAEVFSRVENKLLDYAYMGLNAIQRSKA